MRRRSVETFLESVSGINKSETLTPSGTSKSILHNSLIKQIISVMKSNVFDLALSSIAALILHSGHTKHSVFEVLVSVFKDSTCDSTRKQQVGSIIHAANLTHNASTCL